jgi:hypothetical protein
MKTVALAVLALICTGCTSMTVSQNLASGSIGCSPEEITIVNEDVDNGVHTFQAICKGTEYYCTYMYPNPISCKEASSAKRD